MGIVAWLILTFGGMGWTELLLFVLLRGTAAGFGAQSFYALWSSELFHTKYRAKAQGVMFSIARIGVGLFSNHDIRVQGRWFDYDCIPNHPFSHWSYHVTGNSREVS